MNDLLQTTPATTLDEVYRTLQPSPLVSVEELNAFYEPAINDVRGGDKANRLRLKLDRAYRQGVFFKACIMGHRGVGKSTEISRLIRQVEQQFCTIRFSAMTTLDPGNFRPLDVLLLMMAEVAERTAEPIDRGGAGQRPSDRRLREIWDWFATEKISTEETRNAGIAIEAGAGAKEDSLWNKVLGLFANLKGEIKFASARKTEVVEYRVSRLTSLIEVANRLLDECNHLLKTATGKQWLFVGEDFDRAGIPNDRIEDLFITYANIFQELRTHLIFTLPISLYYSSSAPRLPFAGDCSFVLPDTPVYQLNHAPNENGRSAVRNALGARMNLDLLEPDALERLIVASGGNLRDLFALVNYAADSAILRGSDRPALRAGAQRQVDRINNADATGAIINLRSDFERRLGQSPFDREEVTYEDKADRLVRIYNGEKEAQITDPVLYSLLDARAVQEFNGERWFGVHPLVVDILVKQERLSSKSGVVEGGTS